MLAWIRGELAPMEFEPALLHKIELAAEEVIVNIISHGYQHRPEKIEIEVRLFPASRAEIVFKDRGIIFNPLNVKELDISSDLEERNIGGLGIHFVRELIDEVLYQQEGDQNVLTLLIHSSRKR